MQQPASPWASFGFILKSKHASDGFCPLLLLYCTVLCGLWQDVLSVAVVVRYIRRHDRRSVPSVPGNKTMAELWRE